MQAELGRGLQLHTTHAQLCGALGAADPAGFSSLLGDGHAWPWALRSANTRGIHGGSGDSAGEGTAPPVPGSLWFQYCVLLWWGWCEQGSVGTARGWAQVVGHVALHRGSPQAEQRCWHLSASPVVGTPLSLSTLPLICSLNQKQYIDWPLWELGRMWTQSSTHVYVLDVRLLPLSHPCLHRGRAQCSLAASWEHHGDCSMKLACSTQAPAELE